jgi:DNA-binding response OmpR family regulator
MNAEIKRVLVAECDGRALTFVAENLRADGYDVAAAADTDQALGQLASAIDTVIVDVNGDTLGLVDAIREQRRAVVDPLVPILVLTSRACEHHRVRLLEPGADDVLLKPYSYPELRARLAALLRRSQARTVPQVLPAGMLRLDVRARRVWVGDVEIEPLRAKSRSCCAR